MMIADILKKCFYLAIFCCFFVPFQGKADLVGGNYRIYADSFSVIEDTYSTGGNYGLFSTGGEFSAGIIQAPISGTITVASGSLATDFDDTFTISDGYVTTTFKFFNFAGGNSGLVDGGQVVVDTGGGGADTIEDFADQIVIAINSSTHSLQVTATHDTNDGLILLTNDHGEDVGVVPMTEDITDPTVMTFSGMSREAGNYALRGGFQAMELSALSLTLSTTSIALGTLALDSVASSSLTATVTSDGGYSVSITEDGNLRDGANDIDDIGAGNVTAGTEGYGIRTSGAQGQVNGSDTAVTGGSLTVASSNSSASAVATTVDFRAAVDTDSLAGSYSHTVTFSISSSL